MFEYEGYMGWFEFNNALKIFEGQVANIKTLITFQGQSIESTQKAFEQAIEDYLSWCQRHSQTPEEPSALFSLPNPRRSNAPQSRS